MPIESGDNKEWDKQHRFHVLEFSHTSIECCLLLLDEIGIVVLLKWNLPNISSEPPEPRDPREPREPKEPKELKEPIDSKGK